MGKPRMIILIRHAQSEGNLNRDVHQIIPDHRVKLTPEGWKQAEEAGHRLRALLKPDDTIRIFTSPYRRTRETSEGILRTLTSSSDDHGPSPFSRSAIKVYEEPRLREQDFGNFQPCSAEMERMWRERADYGHFFYRIPNGESAADAYDRCSGFNESLWRDFGGDDFPSVCVLVTHGLMTRVFLMKWYHWSVEYFEDLRNVNHCEFVVMKREENGKYALQNTLRTWSEMKKKAIVTSKEKEKEKARAGSIQAVQSPSIPARKWGGCVDGCNHDHSQFPRHTKLEHESKPTSPTIQSPYGAAVQSLTAALTQASLSEHNSKDSSKDTARGPDVPTINEPAAPSDILPKRIPLPSYSSFASQSRGRDAGGSDSGMPTPVGSDTDIDPMSNPHNHTGHSRVTSGNSHASISGNTSNPVDGDDDDRTERPRRMPRRRTTVEELEAWKVQSGMGRGTRADALGDAEEDEEEDDGEEGDGGNGSLEEIKKEEEQDRSLRGSVY